MKIAIRKSNGHRYNTIYVLTPPQKRTIFLDILGDFHFMDGPHVINSEILFLEKIPSLLFKISTTSEKNILFVAGIDGTIPPFPNVCQNGEVCMKCNESASNYQELAKIIITRFWTTRFSVTLNLRDHIITCLNNWLDGFYPYHCRLSYPILFPINKLQWEDLK